MNKKIEKIVHHPYLLHINLFQIDYNEHDVKLEAIKETKNELEKYLLYIAAKSSSLSKEIPELKSSISNVENVIITANNNKKDEEDEQNIMLNKIMKSLYQVKEQQKMFKQILENQKQVLDMQTQFKKVLDGQKELSSKVQIVKKELANQVNHFDEIQQKLETIESK